MILLSALLLFFTGPACATKPCAPNSWAANEDRPSTEWAKMARWIAVGKVSARTELITPYANCYMKDRSKCAMEDRSTIKLDVLRWEKGKERIRRLSKSYCAPPPPAEIGGVFRFYGNDPGSYIFFEPIPSGPPKKKKEGA